MRYTAYIKHYTQVSLNAGYAEHLTFCHVGVADVVRKGTEVFAGSACKTNKTDKMMTRRLNKMFSFYLVTQI